MPKDYEITLVVDTQLSEGSVDETVNRYETLIGDRGGNLVHVDRWGVRKLAYEIQKRQQGDYAFLQFQAEPGVIFDIDRACRLDESILRHLIVVLEGGFRAVAEDDQASDSDDSEDDEVEEDDDEEEDEA